MVPGEVGIFAFLGNFLRISGDIKTTLAHPKMGQYYLHIVTKLINTDPQMVRQLLEYSLFLPPSTCENWTSMSCLCHPREVEHY